MNKRSRKSPRELKRWKKRLAKEAAYDDERGACELADLGEVLTAAILAR